MSALIHPRCHGLNPKRNPLVRALNLRSSCLSGDAILRGCGTSEVGPGWWNVGAWFLSCFLLYHVVNSLYHMFTHREGSCPDVMAWPETLWTCELKGLSSNLGPQKVCNVTAFALQLWCFVIMVTEMAFPQVLDLTFGLAFPLQQYSRVYCELRLGDAGSSAKGEVIQVKWPGGICWDKESWINWCLYVRDWV